MGVGYTYFKTHVRRACKSERLKQDLERTLGILLATMLPTFTRSGSCNLKRSLAPVTLRLTSEPSTKELRSDPCKQSRSLGTQ